MTIPQLTDLTQGITAPTLAEAVKSAQEAFAHLGAVIDHANSLTPNTPGYPADSLLRALDEYMHGNVYRLVEGKDPADVFWDIVAEHDRIKTERDRLATRVANLEAGAAERRMLHDLLDDVRLAIPADVLGRSGSNAGRVRDLAADRDRLNNRVSQLSAALTKSQGEAARLAERVAELEGELDNMPDDAPDSDVSDETAQMLARAIPDLCHLLVDRFVALLADPDLGK